MLFACFCKMCFRARDGRYNQQLGTRFYGFTFRWTGAQHSSHDACEAGRGALDRLRAGRRARLPGPSARRRDVVHSVFRNGAVVGQGSRSAASGPAPPSSSLCRSASREAFHYSATSTWRCGPPTLLPTAPPRPSRIRTPVGAAKRTLAATVPVRRTHLLTLF